eukprot:10969599-Karenia_brevis.AAC.1
MAMGTTPVLFVRCFTTDHIGGGRRYRVLRRDPLRGAPSYFVLPHKKGNGNRACAVRTLFNYISYGRRPRRP